MIIRQAQIEAFQEDADRNFVEKIADYLRSNHAALTVRLSSEESLVVSAMPAETLRRLVSNGVAQAKEYGLTLETTLTSFVVMMFIASPNFHVYPAVNLILRDENIEPNHRTDRLVEVITEEEWKNVQESYDPKAWNL